MGVGYRSRLDGDRWRVTSRTMRAT